MNDAARSMLNNALARLSEGDRTAAPAVFAALWLPCVQLARAALGNDADAADAAQAALMKLFAEASRFDPHRSALGWALALVTWECRTVQQQRRRRRVDAGADLDSIATADNNSSIERLDKAADVARVAAAFVHLDATDQSTLQRLLDGAPAGEARERKRRQRAIDRLRALVLGPGPLGDDHG
jgi:DNA-directed RNA polymerase specialized sigma24 family protein